MGVCMGSGVSLLRLQCHLWSPVIKVIDSRRGNPLPPTPCYGHPRQSPESLCRLPTTCQGVFEEGPGLPSPRAFETIAVHGSRVSDQCLFFPLIDMVALCSQVGLKGSQMRDGCSLSKWTLPLLRGPQAPLPPLLQVVRWNSGVC